MWKRMARREVCSRCVPGAVLARRGVSQMRERPSDNVDMKIHVDFARDSGVKQVQVPRNHWRSIENRRAFVDGVALKLKCEFPPRAVLFAVYCDEFLLFVCFVA